MIKLNLCQKVNYFRVKFLRHNIPQLFVSNDYPEFIRPDCIYIILEEGKYCYLAMKCPCGCESIIDLSLIDGLKPKWSINVHFNGTVSISPSIWRVKGCRSHFFYRKGKIVWCDT